MRNKIQGGIFLVLLVFAVFSVNAQTKKDKEKELDEIKKVDTTKVAGVWERQGTLEIDGNTDVETVQFNEDGSILYRLNGQVGLFPTPYSYTINYGQIEVKALFDYYYIDGSLIIVFADKKVKTFTRRRNAAPGQQRMNGQQQIQQQPQQMQQQQMQPQQGQQQRPVQSAPPNQGSQNLNPYLR
jgi:hypothetical protein